HGSAIQTLRHHGHRRARSKPVQGQRRQAGIAFCGHETRHPRRMTWYGGLRLRRRAFLNQLLTASSGGWGWGERGQVVDGGGGVRWGRGCGRVGEWGGRK